MELSIGRMVINYESHTGSFHLHLSHSPFVIYHVCVCLDVFVLLLHTDWYWWIKKKSEISGKENYSNVFISCSWSTNDACIPRNCIERSKYLNIYSKFSIQIERLKCWRSTKQTVNIQMSTCLAKEKPALHLHSIDGQFPPLAIHSIPLTLRNGINSMQNKYWKTCTNSSFSFCIVWSWKMLRRPRLFR